MTQITELARGQVNSIATITVELIEANETTGHGDPPPLSVRRRQAARTFAAAMVQLAAIKRDRPGVAIRLTLVS